MSKETFVIHPEFSNFKEDLNRIVSDFDRSGTMVVDGERNTIKKFSLGQIEVNVKRFKTPNIFQSVIYGYFRKGKARRSYEYGCKLLSCGIKTPHPIAYFERFNFGLKESYYLSRHLDYDFEFRMLIHNPSYPNRNSILKDFAAFCFRLHENRINFLDHSPGNTLVKKNSEGGHDFYLIDLNRMKFGSMDLKARMRNLRRLWLSKTMINVMAPVYTELYGSSVEDTHRLMTYYSRKFQKKVNSKKLRRRRKRA